MTYPEKPHPEGNQDMTHDVVLKEAIVPDLTSTRVLVALEGRLVVGFVTWDEGANTLEMVRVSKGRRRKGIGTKLVRAAEEIAGGRLKDTGELSDEGIGLLESMGRKPSRVREKINGSSCGAMLMNMLCDLNSKGELDLRKPPQRDNRT